MIQSTSATVMYVRLNFLIPIKPVDCVPHEHWMLFLCRNRCFHLGTAIHFGRLCELFRWRVKTAVEEINQSMQPVLSILYSILRSPQTSDGQDPTCVRCHDLKKEQFRKKGHLNYHYRILGMIAAHLASSEK